MRTTVQIKDDLLRRAKKRAADEGRTLTSLIEDGLILILSPSKGDRRKRIQLPISKSSGGVLPGVDLNRSGELEEVMNTP
jgi:hypothetical protein